ncbi:hypothetical protein BIFGAL_02933 [Bifidobacterium gallicum DSM 20093 = LMG 11596]|uniref:Uncharacterized protein n=1 Tax=Bifidobacterium gallicum DSM 20093 = LMG 11596 TaxID=561180 RepID=D1NT22_9BIFI|nr:hypothetical protein BIFGAL_02933 [Bifidobacterium gallicum DSM 20093 = LMG 11596]
MDTTLVLDGNGWVVSLIGQALGKIAPCLFMISFGDDAIIGQ